MSIVPLKKITVCAPEHEKAKLLDELQTIGCIHLIPLTVEGEETAEHGPSPRSREALKFLLSFPHRRRQVKDDSKFDAEEVREQALALRDRAFELSDERDFLRHRIEELRPWGEFYFHPASESGGYRLWFYRVPLHQMKAVEETDLIWEVVHKDNRFAYVVVISRKQPEGMPALRTRAGSVPLSQLEARLEEVELELEDIHADRASLTRWCELFARNLVRLEDRQEFFDAFRQTYDQGGVFALQGWAPADRISELETFAAQHRCLLQVEEPARDEEVPTLFRNQPQWDPGEELVRFYMTPSYWLWDPSGIVLFSFAIFFAMIISDAGYAALMGIGLLLAWKKLGAKKSSQRTRRMFGYLVGASVIWGIIVGSYFGMSPAEGSLLDRVKFLDLEDTSTMMALSIIVGCLHIGYANIRAAMRNGLGGTGLANIGWALIIAGGLGAYLSAETSRTGLYGVMIVGALLVLLFTGAGQKPLARAMSGLMGLTGVSKVFGDILSYLRLFALGLASASLALAFNDLARQVLDAGPGVGLLFALVILLIGHALNLVLAIVSGFVHGLRLNLIEFFSWGVADEGRPYRAFAKREGIAE